MVKLDRTTITSFGKIRLNSNNNIALLFVSIALVFLMLFNTMFDIGVYAQQQSTAVTSANATGNNTNTKTFQVTFDSLIINDDHDPLFPGEWVMDAYVNNQWLELFSGSVSVDSGDRVNLAENNTAAMTVHDDERGFIRIATVGWENDMGFDPIPIFFTLMDTRIPFYIYDGLVQQATVPFTVNSANDPNGYVAVQYNKQDNFGVGSHSICSERNVAATSPPGPFDSDCDYRINFTIDEIN